KHGAGEAGLERRCDETARGPAQPAQPPELADDALERIDAVLEPGGVLVAEGVGPRAHLRAEPRKGERRLGELLVARPVEGTRGEARTRAAPDRAELGRSRRADEPGTAATEVDVAVRTRDASVRRRAQLPDQPQLLE